MIHVTQANIDDGIKSDCELCPIALALLPLFPNSLIWVDDCFIGIGDAQYHSPDSIIDFMDDFDNGKPVKPFSFLLEKI